MIQKLKRVIFLLRKKGFKYTYNYIHFNTFYDTQNSFLIKLLPWFVSYPPYVEVEVTTKCNLKCIMCEHTYWDEENRDMSFEDFKKIVDQFPRLKWIGLSGIGESFLNKDFLKMLRYVKQKSIYVELYDTFYFLDETMAKELVELGVDKIIASIDGATKETYESIRVGSNFEKVINNVKTLVDLKEKMNAPFPELNFHYIVSKANISEMPQYVELVHSITKGNSSILFTRLLHNFKEVEDLFTEVPEEIIKLTTKKGEELGVKIAWNLNVPQTKPPINRCTAWIMPFIFVTGHVIPCCAGNEANRREFQKKYSLGNVFDKDFRMIWHGDDYKKLRKMIRSGEIPTQCINCSLFDVGVEK